MALLTAYVASSFLLLLLTRFLHNGSISLILLGKRPFFNPRLGMALNLRPLPFLLLTKRLLLQWTTSNMMPFNFALEASNLGQVFDLYLALLVVVLLVLGLVLVVGVESKSTLVIGGLLHTQHLVKFAFPFMTLYQVFLQRNDLGLELFDFLYMVSNNTSTRGSRNFMVRATRQGR